MKISLLDRIFGCCEKGIHRFKTRYKDIIPPNIGSIEGCCSDVESFIDKLTRKSGAYEVCTRCGKIKNDD